MRLDHRAHGAVEHENALRGGGAKVVLAMSDAGNFGHSSDFRFGLRPQAEQVADRIDEIGAVHRVEMEMLDASVNEVEDLFGGDGRGDEPPGRRIVIEPFEALGEPGRHRGAGPFAQSAPSGGNSAPARCRG